MTTLQNRGRSVLTGMSSVIRLVAREIDGAIGVGGIQNAREALEARRARQTDTFSSGLTPDTDVEPKRNDIRAG
jgi:hypothetical protein